MYYEYQNVYCDGCVLVTPYCFSTLQGGCLYLFFKSENILIYPSEGQSPPSLAVCVSPAESCTHAAHTPCSHAGASPQTIITHIRRHKNETEQ